MEDDFDPKDKDVDETGDTGDDFDLDNATKKPKKGLPDDLLGDDDTESLEDLIAAEDEEEPYDDHEEW